MKNTDKGQEFSPGGRCLYATPKGGTASDFPDALLNAGRTMESHQQIVGDNRRLPVGITAIGEIVQWGTEKWGNQKK